MEGLSPEIKNRAKSSGPSLPVVHLHVVFWASTSKPCLRFPMSFGCLGRQQKKLVSAWALSRRAGPGQVSLLMVSESSPDLSKWSQLHVGFFELRCYRNAFTKPVWGMVWLWLLPCQICMPSWIAGFALFCAQTRVRFLSECYVRLVGFFAFSSVGTYIIRCFGFKKWQSPNMKLLDFGRERG